jgi:hypothetical protein
MNFALPVSNNPSGNPDTKSGQHHHGIIRHDCAPFFAISDETATRLRGRPGIAGISLL